MSVASIQAKGSQLYIVYRMDGKQRWRATNLTDPELAQRLADEVTAVLDCRVRVDAIRTILEEAGQIELPEWRIPITTLWQAYEQAPKPRRTTANTERGKRNHVKAWMEWMAAEHPEVRYVHEVTERLAQEYFRGLVDRGLHAQTRNNARSCLHVTFATLRYEMGLRRNVWDAVPRVEAQHSPKRAFTAKQVGAMYVKAQEREHYTKWPTFWPTAIALAWYTGLRFGDVCTLDWSEVKLDQGVISLIPNKSWRRRRPVVHPIPAEVLPILTGKRSEEGYVWPKVAKAYTIKDSRMFKEFKTICFQCGLKGKDIGFHGLRRAHVTQLRDLAVPVDDIRETVGHAHAVTTDGYSESVEAGRRVAEVMPALTSESGC